jgi:hypothetical protein
MKFTLPVLAALVAVTTALPNANPVNAEVLDINARDAAEGTIFERGACLGRASKFEILIIQKTTLNMLRTVRLRRPGAAQLLPWSLLLEKREI